ncbi:MAG: hypothetical protein K2M16_01905 [Muribaculaceae bacterium]|nr:hypothetical protein [Muribaculaceae bacterium]
MKKTLLLSALAMTAIAIPATANDAARFFKPRTVSYQYYMPHSSTWGNMNVEKYTYNADGSVKTMEETGQKTIYTYNSDGNVSKIEVFNIYNGANKPITTTEYEYDPVVKNFVISETEYFYQGNAEPLYTSGNGTEITRDDAGNVTKVRTYNISNGSKSYDDEQMTVEYGSDNQATKVTIEKLKTKNGQPVSEIEEQWTDIVWDTTDGQILSLECDDIDSDMYFSSNRVASANVISEDLPEPVTFTASYDGDSYHSLVMMGGERIREITFDCLEKFAPREEFDECCSYEAETYEVEFDEDNGQFYIESRVGKKETNTADPFGICLLNEQTTTYYRQSGNITDTETKKTEVTYDEQSGLPIQAAKWEKDDSDKDFTPVSLYFFSDYVNVDPAGVSAIQPGDSDAPVEYFDLRGVRVSNPTDGIFIRRHGTTTEKVYIKF